MKRVTIAVALFLSMLFGSTAFAGGMSSSAKYDTNFVSVGGYYQRGNKYRYPQRYRSQRPRQAFKYVPRRPVFNQWRPKRPVFNQWRPKRPMFNQWQPRRPMRPHMQKRRTWH